MALPAAGSKWAPPRRHAVAFLAFAKRVHRHLCDVGLTRAASSLSFTTLLGLVPLLTVAFASVARFPVFEEWVTVLERFLLRHMLPSSAYTVVHEQLNEFVENAAGLTGVSIVFLVLTAIMATATVEREINQIWGIRSRRPFARRLVTYAVGLTAGPVLVGASIAALTAFLSESVAAVPLRAVVAYGVHPLPLAIVTAGLMLLYGVVPARRVPWRWAAVGAFVAAVALEGAKEAFTFYLVNVPTYKVVYGALAALPIFLLWIYLCWIIVLAGAAVTAALTDPLASDGTRLAGPGAKRDGHDPRRAA